MVTDLYRGAIAAIAVTLMLTLFSYATTPALTFNEGFGYLDGQSYGAMARTFRTGEHYDILAPYAFRVLPPALVAWSGLPYRTGFLLLNLFAYFVAAAALFALLIRYRTKFTNALILIAWWAMLPAGIRLALFYPVLGDGVGTGFSYLLLLGAVVDAPAWFATGLALGVLTRESLVALIPFYGLARGTRSWRTTALKLAVVSAPAVLVFIWVRVAQPIPAANGVSTLDDAVRNWNWFLQNASERAWRFAAAPPP